MIACEFCDLLHRPRPLQHGEKAKCSRCGGVLARRSRNPIEGTLALAIAALVLLVLANVFPFLKIGLEGQVRENT
ncbi:MAG: paraquat-inducible protein A, partial [Dehalococcoidia bacterium]